MAFIDSFVEFIPHDPATGSGDRYGLYPLEGGSFIAFVSDAPADALRDTGSVMEKYLELAVASSGERLGEILAGGMGAGDLARCAVADLLTSASDALVAHGGGSAFTAVTLVAAGGGSAWVATVGHCVTYFSGPGGTLRFGGTTRVGSGVVLDLRAAIPDGDGGSERGRDYIGAGPRSFLSSDVVHVPLAGYEKLVLLSDGAERQLGATGLMRNLQVDETDQTVLGAEQELLRNALRGSAPCDDLTLLLIAPGPAAIPVGAVGSGDRVAENFDELRGRISFLEKVTGSEPELALGTTMGGALMVPQFDPEFGPRRGSSDLAMVLGPPPRGEDFGETGELGLSSPSEFDPLASSPERSASGVLGILGPVLLILGMLAWLVWVIFSAGEGGDLVSPEEGGGEGRGDEGSAFSGGEVIEVIRSAEVVEFDEAGNVLE